MLNESESSSKDPPNNINWSNPAIKLNYSSYRHDRFLCRVRSTNNEINFYRDASSVGYDGPWYHIKCKYLKSLMLIQLPLH